MLSRPQGKVFRDQSRFRVLVAGRRFGKTYLAVRGLLKMAWGPNRLVWYVAPTYRQAKDIVWRELKQLAFPYLTKKPNESDLSLELRWGARIALRSGENYDSLRGPGLDGLVIDEFADIAPEAWTEVLRPMLSDRIGKALFIGTPKGFGYFKQLYDEGLTKADWRSFRYTTLEGGRIPASELEAARADLDAKTFRQEYEASFENVEGRAYYAFERQENVREIEWEPQYPFFWALDFNITPMSSVIGQVIETTNRMEMLAGTRSAVVNVMDEIFILSSNTPEVCEAFHAKMARFRKGSRQIVLNIYGDASGAARQTAGAGSESDWQVVRNFFARHASDYAVSYKYKHSNPLVRDRVTAVNGMLQNALGQRKLFVDPRCKNLIKDLDQVSWKVGAPALDKGTDKMLTHISDALGYLVEAEFGVRPAGGYDPRFIA